MLNFMFIKVAWKEWHSDLKHCDQISVPDEIKLDDRLSQPWYTFFTIKHDSFPL